VSAIDLNLLGISLVDVPLDNQINAGISYEVAEDCGALVLVSETAYGLLGIVSPIEKVVPQENFMPLNTLDQISMVPSHDGVGRLEVGGVSGSVVIQLMFLRTKEGDLPVHAFTEGAVSNCDEDLEVDNLGPGGRGLVGSRQAHLLIGSLPSHSLCSTVDRCMRCGNKRVSRRSNPYLPCNRFIEKVGL
jgi:hypothetical protein